MQKSIMEKFSWMSGIPEIEVIPKDPKIVRIKGKAGKIDVVSRNQRHYVEEELIRSARTWVKAPVTINHADYTNPKNKMGQVVWMEVDKDGVLEYVADVWKEPYVSMLRGRSNEIKGISIEAAYLHNECSICHKRFLTEEDYRNHMEKEEFRKDYTLEPRGIIGQALSIVAYKEEPGILGTTVELMETVDGFTKLCETVIKDRIEKEEYNLSKELKTPGVAVHAQETIIAPTGKQPPKVKEQDEPKQCPKGEHWSKETEKCVPDTPPTEEKPTQETIKKLREILQKCSEKDEFISECSLLVKDLVRDPKDFCGAFWHDKEQWYHGPQKVDLKISTEVKLSEAKPLAPKLVTLKEAKTFQKLSLAEPCDWGKFGYSSFDDCVASNSGKGDPEAYCGSLKAKEKLEIARYNKVVETLNQILDELAKPMQFEMPVYDEGWKLQNQQLAEAINNLATEIKTLPKDDTSWKSIPPDDLGWKEKIEAIPKDDVTWKEQFGNLPKDDISWKEEIKTVHEQVKTLKETHDAEMKTLKETYDAKLKEITDKTEQQKKDFETILAQADKNIVETRKTLDDRIKELEKENKQLTDKSVKETENIAERVEKLETDTENLKEHIPSSFKGRNKDLKTQNPILTDPLKKGD